VADAETGLLNALSVLLIACPCAIGIATPLAAAAAAGRAAAGGVLVRSGEAFERLARARRVFFDKTGTLTLGRFVLRELRPAPGTTPEALLATAAALERPSEHPLARALVAQADARGLPRYPAAGFRAHTGRGVEGRVEVDASVVWVRAGTAAFVGGAPECAAPGRTLIHVAVAGRWIGALVFEDALRPEAGRAVEALLRSGLAVEVLSGDREEAVAAVVADLRGIAASAGLAPEQKLERIRTSVRAHEHPVMVGDGINDGPALSAAGVGVTLDSGTDLAREVADVTVLGAALDRLPWLLGLARATLRTCVLNLAWAFGYNLVGVGLAVMGLLHPLFGAVAMIASSVSVALFSQRLSRYPLPGAEG
jgi:P-type E1-E2 ATPase